MVVESTTASASYRLGGKIGVLRLSLETFRAPSAIFDGQGGVLAEASFFMGHALEALGGDGAPRLGVHGGGFALPGLANIVLRQKGGVTPLKMGSTGKTQ